MADPRRFLDDGGAPEELRSLLRSLEVPAAAPPAKEAALARQLTQLAQVAQASRAPVVTAGAVPAARVAAGLHPKVLWGGAAIALLIGLAVVSSFRVERATPPLAATSTSPSSPPSPSSPDVAPNVTLPAEPTAKASVSALAQKPKTPHDSLADEELLLEEARRLASSNPQKATLLLQKHQQRFPNGQLAAERMYLAFDVYDRLGDTKAAKLHGTALLQRFPHGVYAEKVRARMR